MSYTIKYGDTYRLNIALDKNDNKYTVAIWDKLAHKVTCWYDCKSYEEAEIVFKRWCSVNGIKNIKDTDHAAIMNEMYANYD